MPVSIRVTVPVVAIALATSCVRAQQPGYFALPAPTGAFPVGTTSFHLMDSSRTERTAGAVRFREIEVLAWYPAATSGNAITPAPYLRQGIIEARTFAREVRSPGVFDGLADVRTHAT